MQTDRTVTTPAAPERDLRAFQWHALRRGRWAIFAAELIAVVLQHDDIQARPLAQPALAFLVLYSVVTLAALRRFPPGRVPAVALLAADVLALTPLVAATGALNSPFAPLFFLLSLAAAVYYDVAGGLLFGVVAGALLLVVSWFDPVAWARVVAGDARTQLVPYLLLHGVVAGTLVRYLKQLAAQRIAVEARLRAAEQEEALRAREIDLAREIQRSTLDEPPAHPSYEVAVRFAPAREVGGDFYCFLSAAPSGPRLGVVVGDVTGKGIPAALVSTSFGALLRCLPTLAEPDRVLATLNEELQRELPDWTFVTMALAVLDPEQESLVLYNAGHPPPLLLGSGGVRRTEQAVPPLGTLPVQRFEPERRPFRAGETLLLYSDALIEVRNPAGADLGLEGLEALAARHAGLPPEELADRLLEEVRAFGTIADDLTLVVVRARPGGA